MNISIIEKHKRMTDDALCALVAQGDKTAEESLVLRHTRLVRTCARPYFLMGGDNDDLMQEGMLGLLSAIREFSAEKQVAFRSYATLCIRRRMISAIRAAAGNKHTPLNTYVSFELSLFVGSQEFASLGTLPTAQHNPEDLIIDREDSRHLQDIIHGHLTTLEQEVLHCYLKGLSYAQIAQEVNRSAKSVDNAVQRIRRKLARQLPHSDYSES